MLISRWDLEQRFRFANRSYRDWLGIEPASLLGRSLREVYGDKAYSGFRHHIDAALAGERVIYEREMATPHGPRQVEVTLVPQLGSDGAVQAVYGLISDVTARYNAETQRARSEERLSLALEGSGLALFDWDIGADRIYHSAQASAMRDDLPADQTASSGELRSFVHPDDLNAMQAATKAALVGTVPEYQAEFRIRRRSRDWLWVRARGRVVERDACGRALRLAGTYTDINAHKVAEDRLRRRAEFDTLTDLPNRASFIERLQQAMRRATPSESLALLFLDIDHFKTINDTLGHEMGTRLKAFATRMRDCVRQSDMVARLAGDEFTIILEGLRDPTDVKALASKLVETLRAPLALGGQPFEIRPASAWPSGTPVIPTTPSCSGAQMQRCTRPNDVAATVISARRLKRCPGLSRRRMNLRTPRRIDHRAASNPSGVPDSAMSKALRRDLAVAGAC